MRKCALFISIVICFSGMLQSEIPLVKASSEHYNSIWPLNMTFFYEQDDNVNILERNNILTIKKDAYLNAYSEYSLKINSKVAGNKKIAVPCNINLRQGKSRDLE